MSGNNNTETPETEERRIVCIHINETDAGDILNQFGAPFPAAKDLTEIHLIIKKEE